LHTNEVGIAVCCIIGKQAADDGLEGDAVPKHHMPHEPPARTDEKNPLEWLADFSVDR
jgi:hypothetical protein